MSKGLERSNEQYSDYKLLDSFAKTYDKDEALQKIYVLIHPNTTPNVRDVTNGELLDIIFKIVKPYMEK